MSEAVTNTSLTSLLGWLDRQDWADLLQHHQQVCTSWLPLNHLYYQLANLVLVLFTIFPVRGGSLTLLLLRLGLVLYSLLTILWSLLVSCRLDTLGWGILLAAVNIVFTVLGVFRVYSAYCSRVRPDLRSAYETLFKPLGVSLVQYKVSFPLSRYQSNYSNQSKSMSVNQKGKDEMIWKSVLMAKISFSGCCYAGNHPFLSIKKSFHNADL